MNRLQNVMGCFRMKCDARDREQLGIRIVLLLVRGTIPRPVVPAEVPIPLPAPSSGRDKRRTQAAVRHVLLASKAHDN